MNWHWIDVDPESIEYYKAKKANRIRTLNGVEVWRDAYGPYRLIQLNRNRISNRDFATLTDALYAAKSSKNQDYRQFVMRENETHVYFVRPDVHEFTVGMHPDAFDAHGSRAMVNSEMVIEKATAKVVKARSFDPNGN